MATITIKMDNQIMIQIWMITTMNIIAMMMEHGAITKTSTKGNLAPVEKSNNNSRMSLCISLKKFLNKFRKMWEYLISIQKESLCVSILKY